MNTIRQIAAFFWPLRRATPRLRSIFLAACCVMAGTLTGGSFFGYLPRGRETLQAQQPAVPEAEPNVVVVSIPQLRSSDLWCYGAATSSSPNIDEIASRGITFQNAYRSAYRSAHSKGSNSIVAADSLNQKLEQLLGQSQTVTQFQNQIRAVKKVAVAQRRPVFALVTIAPNSNPNEGRTASIDQQFASLIPSITGISANRKTLLIVCSGLSNARRAPARAQPDGVTESDLRIPIIARWNGVVAPGTNSQLTITNSDIATTIDEIINGKTELSSDNRPTVLENTISFAAEMLGRPAQQRRHEWLIWSPRSHTQTPSTRGAVAVRSGGWKLFRHAASAPWQLFELATDPNERNDLADRRGDLVERLERLLAVNTPESLDIGHHRVLKPATSPASEPSHRQSLGQVILQSESKFKGVAFDTDANLMGLTHVVDDAGRLHLNMAWDLQTGRRSIRFIHLCDADDKIISQVKGDTKPFENVESKMKIHDYVVISADQMQGTDSIKIGFYDLQRKNAQVSDGSGVAKWRFEAWTRQ